VERGGDVPPFLLILTGGVWLKAPVINMPAIIRSEFALALNQVCSERGVSPEVVLETIKAAVLAAYRKDYGKGESEEEEVEFEVEIDSDSGEAKIFKSEKDITPPGFGRIAAQTAKQVILQRIREAEKEAILSDYAGKVGTLISGMVIRLDRRDVVVDIGKAEGVMPVVEQIPQERYRVNQRLSFYIAGIKETMRGSQVIVSRAHKGLVEALFRREVPEVQSGAVEIKEIAREAGNRTKVAVASTQAGVDPVGSCVGQKGVRVQAVINELGGMEKIDIISFDEDKAKFIQAALAPATEIEVKLDEKSQTAVAMVPEDQLSLAIGKEGQNVRLAAKLTGWKIDIKGKEGVQEGEKKDAKDKKEKEKGQKESKKKETKKTAKKEKKEEVEVKKGKKKEKKGLSVGQTDKQESEKAKSEKKVKAGSGEDEKEKEENQKKADDEKAKKEDAKKGK